uniref:TNFR-Cys domain-containing protein n=1 Tax=Poecilia reticulata TaxID=8081 RepID=A0A3P9Q823_POERE
MEHITPVLKSLHWLPVAQRIDFKILMLVYKSLNGLMTEFRVYSFTCHQTEYKIEEKCCPLCSPGHRVETDCTEIRPTSCLPCTDRTYMVMPNGLRRCTPCSTCDSAGLREKQQCRRSADTVCEPKEGLFCTNSTLQGCVVTQKHKSCKPGQYISRMGTASTDTECLSCTSGTFSSGTMLTCQPHTQCEKENLQLIKAGTASTDAECGENGSNILGVVIGVLVFFAVVVVAIYIQRYQTFTIPGEWNKCCLLYGILPELLL